jgi:L-cysteine:1D-myo-inositol 2-amino-2-deoxy-alpha-D-glucopyranoside ligase
MRLFDTARQAVVPFKPRGDRVGLYVCGITPYDSAHLGHAFAYHVYDVITRRLRDGGITVQSVRNVTDVDDDILRAARARSVDFLELANKEIALFDSDMRDIGLLPVSAPRATQHVPEMVLWIERLVDAGFAYEREGWVFFDTRRFAGYGRLARLDDPVMIALSRERGADPDDGRKLHPLDFVLWQRSAPDEPSWPSAWSDGRPGWHIECAVMSSGELGTPVDIHGGGDDLIFPHHECELAEAESAGVVPFVRHWVHVAMVRYEGEKMSKSLGNLVFVRDLLERTSSASVRLLLADHHFRESWDFEDSEMRGAEERRRRYVRAMASGNVIDPVLAATLRAEFLERIDDNLDTPGALRVADRAAAALMTSTTTLGADAVAADELMTSMLDVIGVMFEPAVA